MPYVRRYAKKKYVPRRRMPYRRRVYRPRMMSSTLRNPTPTFTETFALTSLQCSTTGTTAGRLRVAMNQVPQFGDYQALYNQYRINSVTFILIPEFDMYDSNNSSVATISAVTAPRLVYAIQDSAQSLIPATEQDVLQDNGCKIRSLSRPIRIRCRPVAEVSLTDSNTNPQYESKRRRFLSFNTPGTAHGGVSYAITQTVPNSVLNLPAVKVYAKVNFTLRDPK